MSSRKTIVPLILIGILIIPYPSSVFAKEASWQKYENGHFVAYSNASEKKARDLLQDLERFRGAVLQVSNIAIPESAPKTIVLITRSEKEFSKLKPSRNTAGFSSFLEDRTVIVMPASGSTARAKTVIRHEFCHALLRYSNFDYPIWYEEGFAEMASATEFKNKGRNFTLGAATGRAIVNGPLLYDWDDLVSDDFAPHAIKDIRKSSSAYVQAWMLAHYTTIGGDGKNAYKLQSYFNLLKQGQSSTAAFQQVFNASADELWNRELKSYIKHYPYYIIAFKPNVLDLEFQQTPAADSEYQPIVDFFRMRSTAHYDPKTLSDPLKSLPGSWGYLALGGSCENPGNISVDTESKTITVDQSHRDAKGHWVPATFTYIAAGDGVLLLKPTDGVNIDSVSSSRMDMRSDDLLCIRSSDSSSLGCRAIMKRCR